MTVDSEEEAAQHISRKLAKAFRKSPQQSIAILNFTDEYGDRLNRGVFFADMVTSGLLYYRNPIVVERESLYEIVKEQELSQTNLIADRGTELNQLVQADYIMSGRILRGRQEDMISVRCFRVGTGEVVYASTISIDYTPDPIVVPTPTYPQGPGPIVITQPQDPIVIIDNSGDDQDAEIDKPVNKPADVYKPKPVTGTEGKGKVNLNNLKKPRTDDGQYQSKKPAVDPKKPVKKPTTNNTKTSITNKATPVKKNVKIISKPKTVYNKVEVQESEEEETEKKASTLTSTKDSKASKTSSANKKVTYKYKKK